MNTGDLLLKTAFVVAIAAGALYLPALSGRKSPKFAHYAFILHVAALVAAIGLLLSYFVGHRFEFAYVAQYSSRALSPALALAASWAGQEGSVLLWSALLGLTGLALMRQPGPLMRPAMFFVSLIQVFMVSLLIMRSPFRMQIAPPDGMGLNPLLEDPWMISHPPALFIGYAALAIPFALAAAALVRRDYKPWGKMVWPWALFGTVSLGMGIVLGGIWAYKVLGWGGFWGWDPVENASLIPWLTSIALIHGLLIQRTTGSHLRTNLLLSIIGWVLVLGGTYLTRSGILQDFSVHSFADSGLNGLLIMFLGSSFALGVGLLTIRWATIPGGKPLATVSRESALWLGLVTVLILAAMVAVGTTAPLLTGLAGQPASVQTEFYNLVSLPLGIILVLLMALAPALRWSRQNGLSWVRTMIPGIVLTVLAAVIGYIFGVREPSELTLLAVSGMALGVNVPVTFKLFRRGWTYGAGYLGHVGIAVMVLGIIVSGTLSRTQRVNLVEGQSADALGYRLTYSGMELDERGRRQLLVNVQSDGWNFEARPVLTPSPQTGGIIRTPAISGARDLYISPLEASEESRDAEGVTWLEKGREIVVDDVGYTFAGFRMEGDEVMRVFADVEVRQGATTHRASPSIVAGPDGKSFEAAVIHELGTISLAQIDADNRRVAVELPGGVMKPGRVSLEVSTKPWIHTVWIGALLALLGTAIAGMRRAAETVPAQVPGGKAVHAGRPAKRLRAQGRA